MQVGLQGGPYDVNVTAYTATSTHRLSINHRI